MQASRVDLNKHWRNGHKRIDKLQASLAARIPKSWPAEMGKGFLEKIAGLLSAAFAAVSPPKVCVANPLFLGAHTSPDLY